MAAPTETFQVEFNRPATIIWFLAIILMSLFFFSVALFFLFVVYILIVENTSSLWVLLIQGLGFVFGAIIILILACGLILGPWRYLKLALRGDMFAILTKEGIQGYNGIGLPRNLSWSDVDACYYQTIYKNFIIRPKPSQGNKLYNAIAFFGAAEYLAPNAVIIPMIFSKQKMSSLNDALIELAPELMDMHPLKEG